MHSYRLSAVVIKRRNFLEKDRILTLFSSESGKIEALAKGARRPGNRLSPNSDLATAAKFHIHRAKSLDIITEIEPFFHPDGIRGKFSKTQKIGFALKVIDRLFELDESYPRTYRALLRLIKSVSEKECQLIFLKFLVEVLADLGALPNFTNCPTCHKVISSKDEFVFSFQGGLTHKECLEGGYLPISEEQAKVLRIVANSQPDKIINLKINPKIFEESYELITRYFNYEFGKILPDEVM